MGITADIASYLSDLVYSDIPSHVLEEMKFLLFDYLGVALGGSRTESGKIAAKFSYEFEEKGEATIIGFKNRVSAPGAAFSNAISSHSIELDDVDNLAYFHFGPPICSAALAMAESLHASGKGLIIALVAGCDIMARLSSATNPSLRDRGFHTTPTCGVFAAAASSAKLLGLDTKRISDTLGLAGAQVSGVMEMYGSSMQKRFNPGPAARGGVVSALLAQRGFTGAETIFEGERGFLHTYSDNSDESKLTDGLGRDFPIFIEYKPYACARPIHNAIDCALTIRSQHKINPNQISKIIFFRHPEWAHYHINKTPCTYHEAQVSLPYSVAVSLLEGEAFFDQYSEERLHDPLIRKLSTMMEIRSVDNLPRGVSCRMEIICKSGEAYSAQIDYPKGSPQNPMTLKDRRHKFKRLTMGVLSEQVQAKAEEKVFEIETLKDVAEILTIISAGI